VGVRGCFARLVVLALLTAGAIVAWQNRDQLAYAWDRWRGPPAEVSPELAEYAEGKLSMLNEDGGADRVALTAPELQSLVEYRWGGVLPQDVTDPRVSMGSGRVVLEANVATARFGRMAELREIVGFLPDTTSLRAVGSLVPMDDGQVALEVHELAAATIPLPRQLIAPIMARFPGGGQPGLPPNAVILPLPPGIRTIYVSGDSMVFVAHRARSD
jgi:hypothetical protein